jgi:hypothetical protein
VREHELQGVALVDHDGHGSQRRTPVAHGPVVPVPHSPRCPPTVADELQWTTWDGDGDERLDPQLGERGLDGVGPGEPRTRASTSCASRPTVGRCASSSSSADLDEPDLWLATDRWPAMGQR